MSIRKTVALTMGTVLLLAACAGTSAPTSAPTNAPSGGPTVAPTQAPSNGPTTPGVSGTIFVSGSSTVEPVSLAVSEDFQALNSDFGYTVEGPGTGDGFALFCDGTTDVADASRGIRDTESQACADNGVNFTELLIGVDALTVMTHPDTAIDCLVPADLYALFGPESDNITTWKEAEALAHELGSTTIFPDLPLQITAPGEESGTYDAFIELADIGGPAVERGVIGEDDDPFLRVPGPNYTASPSDNVIIEGVEAGAGSLGFVGYAFFAEAGDQVKAIQIDSGEGCVGPSPETASDGSYVLTRPLFIYPNNDKADENAALQAWVDFFLSDAGIANVADVGYVTLPASDMQATRDTWANR